MRRLIKVYEQGDLDTVSAHYDPEIEWHVARVTAGMADFEPVYVGHEGVRAFFREWFSAWEVVTFDYEEFMDAGDQVVVVLNQRMRGRASGVELEWRSYAQLWTIKDGRAVRSEYFPSAEEALQAAGVSS